VRARAQGGRDGLGGEHRGGPQGVGAGLSKTEPARARKRLEVELDHGSRTWGATGGGAERLSPGWAGAGDGPHRAREGDGPVLGATARRPDRYPHPPP
jgi:hypothetical protein